LPNEIVHNENELVKLVAAGDVSAFGKLFAHYKDRIYSIAYKLSKSTVISEEIVQDVFLKIWLRRDSLDGIQNFSAYLFVITRNDVYKVLREIGRNYKTALLPDEDQTLSDHDTAGPLMEKEYNLLLQNAIDRLPRQQKQVYHLVKDWGLKRDEVAHQLQIQPETVKFHLAQAAKNIRAFCMLHLNKFIGLLLLLLHSEIIKKGF
jgi:RNA polymerase sigma-70 factor (ECF subfamily)